MFTSCMLPLIYTVSVIPGYSQYYIISGKTLESSEAFLKESDDGHNIRFYKTTFEINKNYNKYNLSTCDTYDKKLFVIDSEQILYMDTNSIHKSSNDYWSNRDGFVYKNALCFTPRYLKYEITISWVNIGLFGMINLTIGIFAIYSCVQFTNKNSSNRYDLINSEDSIQLAKLHQNV